MLAEDTQFTEPFQPVAIIFAFFSFTLILAFCLSHTLIRCTTGGQATPVITQPYFVTKFTF